MKIIAFLLIFLPSLCIATISDPANWKIFWRSLPDKQREIFIGHDHVLEFCFAMRPSWPMKYMSIRPAGESRIFAREIPANFTPATRKLMISGRKFGLVNSIDPDRCFLAHFKMPEWVEPGGYYEFHLIYKDSFLSKDYDYLGPSPPYKAVPPEGFKPPFVTKYLVRPFTPSQETIKTCKTKCRAAWNYTVDCSDSCKKVMNVWWDKVMVWREKWVKYWHELFLTELPNVLDDFTKNGEFKHDPLLDKKTNRLIRRRYDVHARKRRKLQELRQDMLAVHRKLNNCKEESRKIYYRRRLVEMVEDYLSEPDSLKVINFRRNTFSAEIEAMPPPFKYVLIVNGYIY